MKAKKPDDFPDELTTGWRLRAAALYRRFLDKRFSRFSLAGLVSDDEPVLLRQIYVPLVLTPQAVSDSAPEEKIHEGGLGATELLRQALDDSRRVHTADDNIVVDVMPSTTLFISGEAGSGKTTLATSIVTSLAGSYPDDFNRRFVRFFPFPILLREVPVDRIGSLDELMAWWLAQAREVEPELDPEHLLPILDYGQGILILDGLDEVGSLERRRRVLGWLEHRWVIPSATANLTLVTARPSGFDGLTLEYYWGRRVHVAPFSVEQVRTFLTKWFELRPLSPTRRKESVESLIQRLVSDDRMTSLRALSRRPAYLASLAFVHGTRGALPHTRAALYESLVDAYIDVLDRQRGIMVQNWDRQEKREVLSAVAYAAHVGATDGATQTPQSEDRRFVWSRAELEHAVATAIDKGKARFRTLRPEDARELTEYYLARTGLIVESHEGRYQFGHLSFQEYLAALYALDRASGAADRAKALEKLLLDRLDKPGWVEVTLLALATDATRTQGMGHRAVLARLDPAKYTHVDFLRVVLSGEELPLGEDERRAWILAYLLRASTQLGGEDHRHLVDLDRNRATIVEAWHAVAGALLAGSSVVDALRELLPPASRAEDDLGSLDPLEAPRAWARGAPGEAALGAQVLALPLDGELVPDGARERVLRLAGARPWFREDTDLPGIPVPEPVWAALNAWTLRVPEVLPALVARTPFAWLCGDDSVLWPATLAARWHEDGAAPLARARSRAWRSILAVERWGLFIEGARELDRARARARDRARALDLARARALDLARTRALARALDMARTRDRDLDLALDLDRALALARALARARALDRALAQARALARARDRDRARARARALDLDLLDVLQRDPPPSRSWQERAAASIASFHLAIAINRILGESSPTPRASVEAERAAMAEPDYLGRDLTDPADRAQARAEWTDFLRSALSPIPMLDAVLATDFTEIDASTKAVTERFEREAEALLREAGAGVPPESKQP